MWGDKGKVKFGGQFFLDSHRQSLQKPVSEHRFPSWLFFRNLLRIPISGRIENMRFFNEAKNENQAKNENSKKLFSA
jgi:hypothetical protein